MKSLITICGIVVIILSATGILKSATIYVPTNYTTIQAAINDAVNGDEIVVADGTYTGAGNRDIDFLGKAIALRSENGPDTCIIDLEGNLFDPDNPHNGFHFHNGEDETSILDGFTIANTVNKDTYVSYGAGVWCENDSGPTIVNCIITGNKAWDGGGVYGSKGPITNCTIGDNVAYHLGGGGLAYCDGPINNCNISNNFVYAYGGGLKDCGGPITNCTISNNFSAQWGGGLYDCDGPVTNCTISENVASEQGGGLHNCDGPISNSTISGNSTQLYGEYLGGGLCYCDGLITGCIICGNNAAAGGGLYVCAGPIIDCIISNNSALVSGGLECCGPVANSIISGNIAEWRLAVGISSNTLTNCTIVGNESGSCEDPWLGVCTVTNSIIWGNTCPGSPLWNLVGTVTYSCIQDWTAGGEGNILDDPLFVDAASSDYHLQPSSPCIDAGTNTPIGGLPATDIEGNPRLLDGDGDGVAMADMGAYESALPDPPQQLANLIEDVIELNLQQGIESNLYAKLEAAQQALDDMNDNNDVAAINSLKAFINAIEAQRGNKISNSDANALIAAAQQIIDLITAG